MQCYEYLAIQKYARRNLGEWAREVDDLDLAETLDERDIRSMRDIDHIDAGANASQHRHS